MRENIDSSKLNISFSNSNVISSYTTDNKEINEIKGIGLNLIKSRKDLNIKVLKFWNYSQEQIDSLDSKYLCGLTPEILAGLIDSNFMKKLEEIK